MSTANGVAVATGDPVHPLIRPGGAVPRETPPTTTADWYPPEGLTHRGTVVLLPGRGEHPGVYERFGRRLAADAYVVHVLDARDAPDGHDRHDGHDGPAVGPDRSTAQLAAEVDAIAAGAARPLVLAGSDTGALHALAAATRTAAAPDALLLAGTPAPDAAADTQRDAAWSDELEARTACPAHRGRLAADPRFATGALSAPVPGALSAEAAAALAALPPLPVLILHGAADPVAPLTSARALAGRLPQATFATVRDGRHDSFNDIQHRSVAALVVQWLERLRGGTGQGPVLSLEGTPVV